MVTVKCNDEIEVEVVKGAWVYAGNTSNGDGVHIQWDDCKHIAECCELAEEIAQKAQLLYDKIHQSASIL